MDATPHDSDPIVTGAEPPRRRTIILAAALLPLVGWGQPAPPTAETVDLEPSQLAAITIAAVGTRPFSVEITAMGNLDYDEDRAVQVFPSYPGKIIGAFANLGDQVQAGQPLFTVESPDLVQAESTLIGAAATFELTRKERVRAQELFATNGVAERELEQATSDAETAAGALRAARDAVRVFGKTEAEIDRIIATGRIDPALVVRSPVTGRVTARDAQPGLLVQPGNAPAPYAVADSSVKWMVGWITESDSPRVRVGQPLVARVMAFPGRVFRGRISAMGAAVDPNTHRVMVRGEIPDPADELRPGMLATFSIRVRGPVISVALPATGVVWNGDGTLTAWVTTDRRRFHPRLITVGLEADGEDQVLSGLRPGELAVTDGAVFLSNILYAPPSD